MKALLDGAGRIEVPDFVRVKLGAKPGDELALDEENSKTTDGGLEPGRATSLPSVPPKRLLPGWYAVSLGLSHGGPWIRIHDGAGHEATLSHGDFFYFQDLVPTARVG